MRINCFEKIKHKEVQQLQAEFNSRVGEDTDLSEQEQKEIGKEIVMRYYRELNNKINALKQDINPNAALSEITDTSIEKKSMEDLYDGLIQKENEGIEQVKKEENEKSKFQNQSPADQIQIIKAAELEATTAINSNNPEAAAAAIEKLDYITKSTPEQIARDAGQKEVDGTIIKRQDSINAVKGKPVNILFSKDKTQEGNYAVIELDDLQPSHKNGIKNDLHFIPEAQPRDRGALEVLKNEAKKKADSLDPAQLADNNIAYFGTPIINARGEIIQGNGRGEAVDYYYHNNQADSKGYRKMVQDKAKELVMDEAAVAKMKYPVLVRMVDVNDEEAIRLGNFTSSDLEDVKQKGAEAKAAIGKLKAADMQQLSDTIGSKVGENDTLKSAIRDNAKSIIDLLMDLGVLRTDNREQYFNQDGVTPEGIEAAHSIVKQLLFEGGANDLQGKFDNLPFAQREAIEKTIPAILTNPELKSHIQKAIEIIHDKIESGTPQFSTWAKQYDMFKGNSPVELYDKADLALARKFDEAKTQKEIASTIKELAVLMNGKLGDLFSDAQEGIPFNDAMAEKNILFSVQAPTTEEVEDMKDIIAELVDDGTLRLSEIQDYVAEELEDSSPELRDLVATAYHEYGKDKQNTPVEVTKGVIGRIGQFLSNLFGGTAGEKIFIAKDSESLRRKARDIGNGVQFSVSMPDGSRKEVKTVNEDVVNGFYSPLEKTINETKFDKLPAKQWQEKYANSEEAKWTGLSDWLKQQEGSVSKADIQKYLKDNRIQVVEVVKGEVSNFTKDDIADVKINQHGAGNWVVKTKEDGTVEFPLDKADDKAEAIEYALEQLNYDNKSKRESKPKFQQYQLEGEKENYREVLVTMPSKKEYANIVKNADGTFTIDFPEGVKYYSTKTFKTETEATKIKDEWNNNNKKYGGQQGVKFKSSHFDEPNILVHLRMNTRTDAEGNKVLFLEEVQSDWGQKGKKEGGFAEKFKPSEVKAVTEKENSAANQPNLFWYFEVPNNVLQIPKSRYATEAEARNYVLSEKTNRTGGVPSAPFVTDTNSWTKLGLKVALKEAVKQGADKIAWTTGEQQNNRYDLSKQVDDIYTSEYGDEWDNGKYEKRKEVEITLKGGETKKMIVDESGKIVRGDFEGERLDNIIGKDIAEKILKINENTNLSGEGLKVGGKGMKGFYGSPSEKSLGIVGNVAKSLFKQEPKTTNIFLGNERVRDSEGDLSVEVVRRGEKWLVFNPFEGEDYEYNSEKEAWDYADTLSKKENEKIPSIQHSIDITPELKAQVEVGQPLFMKSPDGEILGFTHEVKIYLNGEKLNPNTPVHEAGHIWTEWVKQNNTPIYNRGIQLITGSRYMDTVTQNSFYKKEAEKLPIEQRNTYYQNEALAMAIGDRGAQFITEAKKSGFKEWLKNLWDTIAKAVGFKDVTADELSSMTLDEFSKRAAAEILKGEQLQAQEKQYEKVFNDKMSGYEMTTSEEVNKMLSGKTMADVFGEAPEGEQSYYVQKKVDMLQDGKNMIGIAQGMWGTDLADYGKPLFNYIKNMPNDISLLNKKAVLMATFLGEIKEEILRRPERRDELKKLDNDVTEYYQQYMNVRGKEIAAGALLRIYRDKYMGDVFADKILEEAQIREQRRIRKAESDINVNDVSEEAFAPMSKEDAEKEEAAAQQQADAKKSKSGKPKMSQTDAEKMALSKLEEIKSKGDASGLDLAKKLKDIIDNLNCK